MRDILIKIGESKQFHFLNHDEVLVQIGVFRKDGGIYGGV